MRPPLLTLFIVAASLLMGALVTIQVAGGRLDVTSKAWQMATMFDFAVSLASRWCSPRTAVHTALQPGACAPPPAS